MRSKAFVVSFLDGSMISVNADGYDRMIEARIYAFYNINDNKVKEGGFDLLLDNVNYVADIDSHVLIKWLIENKRSIKKNKIKA